MLNEPKSIEMTDQKLIQPNGNHEDACFPESTKNFIEKNFNVRIGTENKINENECKLYGVIHFQGYDHSLSDLNSSFIRFDCLEDEETKCDSMYKLLTENEPWMFKIPKLIISINGGLNEMNFKSKKYKDNLTRGLIEVIKRDQTWIIGSGFDNGVEKFVAEDIFKWKHEQEHMQDAMRLIGITNWGSIYNNHKLLLPELTYEYCLSDENGKYLLNDLNDHFIFCNNRTEQDNGTEIDFRVKFEHHLRLKVDACLVQILFDGDKHALKIAHKTLQTQLSLLVIKGSGGAANIIAKIAELPKKSGEGALNDIIDENIELLKLSESERSEYRNYLFEIYDNFLEQIFICNVMDSSERFERKILQAMILGNENSLEKILTLCIRLNCPKIADKYVFSDLKYKNIDQCTLETLFKSSIVNNKPEFVKLFLANKFNVHNFINGQTLKELYMISFDPTRSKCGELLSKFLKQVNLNEIRIRKSEYEILFTVGVIIKSLSGHIIENPYRDFDKRTGSDHNYENNKLGIHDLFQWSLLSGLTDMSEIFWKTGQDNIGSALIASCILKNMASQIFFDGDNNLQKSLTDASEKYQGLAVSTLTDAYGKCKSKTYSIITRPIERWNKLTCVQIASYGNMVEFLNHEACKFHSMMAWMGGLPHHLCTWKILLTIPFSLVLMRILIMPSFPTKKSFGEDINESNCQNYHLIEKKDDMNRKPKQKVSFCEAMGIFYRAPVVKFFVYVFSYVTFLLIFTYMNLVEFKPLEDVPYVREMAAELFVYVYIFTFSIDEIRQIRKIRKVGFSNKLKEYLSLGWNKLDAVIIAIFIASVITRITIYRPDFVICRCLYSIVLSLFYLRSMYFYFANQKIGPQIIMMRDMLRVILFFLSMYVIFLMSYGTLVQSLNYPNKKLNFKLLVDVLYLPYLQSNGELNLEQLEDSAANSRSKSIFKTITIFSSFAVFLLITNVLLMNLLIAMFFYTYYEIQEQAGKRWYFLKFNLIQIFTVNRLLPPPLNILYCLVRIISIPFRRCCRNEINLQPVDNDQHPKLRTFEQNSALIAKFELEDEEIDNKYKLKSNNITEVLGKINDRLENGALTQQHFHRKLNKIGKQIVDISRKIKNLKNIPQ